MNETPLLDQIRVYSEALMEDLPEAGRGDALLVLVNERNERTNVEELAMRVQPVEPTRRGWLVVAAMTAIVLVVLAPMLLFSGGNEPDVGGTGPDTAKSAPAALAVVESAFAAYNSGDMATWFLWREGGRVSRTPYGDYLMAVGSRLDVEECTHRGYAVWQMGVPMTGHGFDCSVTQTDLILGAAGIELEMTYNWVIGADPESSLGGANEDFDFLNGFMKEYRDWLDANYPDSGITYDGLNRPSSESVPTALEYIDEFVAQSDVYPLTEPVPAGDYFGPLCLHLDALCPIVNSS